MNDLGSLLCQHIVGMNPKEVGKYSPSNDRIKGDNSENLNNIEVHGEDDSVKDKGEEEQVEETQLLNQEFLLDNTMSVGELIAQNGVHVVDFVRYACGEVLDADKEE